jgi:autotransporter translocation and assembly factor TamB
MVAFYLNLPLKTIRLRRFLKITARVLLILLGLVILLFLAIQTDPVQNWLAKRAAARLSRDLNTEVTIKNVSFSLLNRMDLDGLLIRDHQKDTLLFAGAMKVRITDWFIFKDQADLKYIGLENAVIKTNRTDSVWNYQFIADYFSSPSSAKTNTANKKKGISLDLKKLDLQKITFIQEDKWRGETMTLKVASLLLNGNKMDFAAGDLDIADLTTDKLYFAIHNYTGKRNTKPAGGAFRLRIGVNLKIANLELNNATFVNDKVTARPVHSYFDGAHMVVSKINGTIKNFSYVGDTIRGKIDISAKERSGFEIKKLKADFRFDTQQMEFANLDLQTPRSRLRDYFSMRYSEFEDDMGEFVDNVVIHARFKQADINSNDIAYFDPEARSWNKEITASGDFNGTVQSFRGSNVYVRAGNSTVTGDVAVNGITDINSAMLNLYGGTVTTTYNELAQYVPSIRNVTTPDLRSLGNIRFNGNFSGTTRKFTTRGTLSTSLGNAYTDLTMKLPEKGEATYSGAINTQRFNLGKFLDIDKLGMVSLNGKISGSGFSKNTVKTKFEGNIGELNYGTYTYRNIATNGTFQKGAFAGEVRMNDPNLNVTSNINIDFNGAQPRFIVLGDVAKADLRALNITKDKFELAGLFDLDFTGTNIDNFIGYAKLINATLLHDSTRLAFDSLSIATDVFAGNKLLTVKSNELDAYVTGQYNILDLPMSIQSYLHNYFPSYIDPPSRIPKDQRFTIDLTTRNIADYLQILDPKISGFDNATVSGSINTTRPDSGFAITTNVPYFRYDKVTFNGVQFNGTGNATALKLNGSVDLITYGDSTYFPNTKVNIESANDVSSVSIKTKANNTLNEADLNATVTTLEDGVQIDFKPSSFVINDEKWSLEKEGELVLRKHYVAARDIKFTQGFQEVTVSTRTPDGGNVDELVINLKSLHLGDFIRFVTKEPQMEGLVSGEVVISDIFDQLTAHAALNAQEFQLDNDSLGRVNIFADYSKRTGKVNFRFESPNEPYNLTLEGIFSTKDSTGSPLSTTLRLNNTRIGFINRFLGSIFSDIDGYATGNLQIIGDMNRPHLLGKVKLVNAGMKVNYTQVYYKVDEANLDFQDDRIDFGSFTLRDQYNNSGTARGILYQHAFKNMRFDFDLSTNKMLLLDTRFNDNQNFYGHAVGRATLNIRGGEENLQMNITGEMNDTSHIFIPTGNSRESGEADYIVFKQPGKEVRAAAPVGTNLTVDLDVTATNKAAIDLILDPLAGDVLKARGNGRLRIHAGTTDKVTINGRYNVEQGGYDFNFQSLIRKPFTIDPTANNYLEWTGDPYGAEMHIDVMYKAEKVSLSDLIANKVDLGSAARIYRGNVNIIAALRGNLSAPKPPAFRFEFPSNSELMNDPTFEQFLAKLQHDENEMNKQVTYLLLFNSFAPYGEGRNVTQNLYNYAYKGLSDIINKQVNNIVNDLLFKITGNRNIKVDISTSFYSSSSLLGNGNPVGGTLANLSRLDRSTVDLKIPFDLLKGKIIFNIGGNVDFALQNNASFQNNNFQWLPDWDIEFILGKSGKLRMIVFQRNSLDINTVNNTNSLGRRNRYGISLSYSKDFD